VTVDAGMASAWVSVVLFAVFIGIVVWAWSDARQSRFTAAARLPLEDDDAPGSPRPARNGGGRE